MGHQSNPSTAPTPPAMRPWRSHLPWRSYVSVKTGCVAVALSQHGAAWSTERTRYKAPCHRHVAAISELYRRLSTIRQPRTLAGTGCSSVSFTTAYYCLWYECTPLGLLDSRSKGTTKADSSPPGRFIERYATRLASIGRCLRCACVVL